MRVLWPYNHKLARQQLHISRSHLGIKSTVGSLVVWLCLVGAVLDILPSYCLLAFEQDMYVDVLTVCLKHLVAGSHTLWIDIIDEEVVALKLNTSARGVEQVVGLHVVEHFLKQGVKRLYTVAML